MLGAVVPALGPYRAPKHLLLGDGWSPRIDCTESVWMAPRCPPATPDPPAAEGASEVVGGLGRGQQEPLGLQLSQPCAPQHHEGMKGSGFKRCKHLQDLFRSVFTPKVWGAPCSPSIWECIPSPPNQRGSGRAPSAHHLPNSPGTVGSVVPPWGGPPWGGRLFFFDATCLLMTQLLHFHDAVPGVSLNILDLERGVLLGDPEVVG